MHITFIRDESLCTKVRCDWSGASGTGTVILSNDIGNQKQISESNPTGIKEYNLYEYCLPVGGIYTLSATATATNGANASVTQTITPVFEFSRLIEQETHYSRDEKKQVIETSYSIKSVLLKYNQEISSFKSNYIDVVTPTLGGAYPFIRRNGAQKYRSFGLNGLIYLDEGLVDVTKEAQIRQHSTDEYATDLLLQKLHRDEIIKFLENGKVKLFKSMQEGDMFVYLSNVSLTPDKVSGRALYSFSCTATEVCAPEEGYEKYLGGFLI